MSDREWSNLPPELLKCIADRLGLIGLLCFRGVCKDWNSASEAASAEIESLPDHEPWFLLCGDGEGSQCHLVTESGEKYALDIPELNGATSCIASNGGWLLLRQEGSLLFFCPFSRTKIVLPQLPQPNLSNHVACFSSSPTSEDCIVGFIGYNNESTLELYLLQRGHNAWTKHELRYYNIAPITCAACHEGTLYFFNDRDEVIIFSINGKGWKSYVIVSSSSNDRPVRKTLPFTLAKQEFKRRDMNRMLGLEEGVSVSVCGTVSCQRTYDKVVFNEMIKVDADDKVEDKTRNLKGVWIQPRFFKISPEFCW